ncbi:hypothetical protein E2C01_070858 [Portunus trituberculatus]|uniref:Uncharacterized protein n=1 Tax=Portunus trituberculatus TaxID=210409 RepID=A0A5B7I4R5_PORTR|nr:hypothetical protein [Portunus trituberculatus]
MQVDLYGRFSLMAGWKTPPPWAERANDQSDCYDLGRFGKIIVSPGYAVDEVSTS